MAATTQTPAQIHDGITRRDSTLGVLRLLRPANLVTAAADVVAGCAIVGALHGPGLVLRIFSGMALYGGGVVLNDYFDRYLDSVERPERPIPSGVVSPRKAAVIGLSALVLGIAAAAAASRLAGIVAALIALLVLAYNALLKGSIAGPFIMGSCRALNLTLGLTAAPLAWAKLWWLALLPLTYIAAFTFLSRGEVSGGSRRTSAATLVTFTAVVAALLILNHEPLRLIVALPFVLLLAVRVSPRLIESYRRPVASTVRSAVHAGIVSLVLFDAALAAGYSGLVTATGILMLAGLAMLLGGIFSVT